MGGKGSKINCLRRENAEGNICTPATYHQGDNPVDGLKQVQGPLSYLACSRVHHYVPEDIWEHPQIKEHFGTFDEQKDPFITVSDVLFVLDQILKSEGKCELSEIVFGSSYHFQRCCSICQHKYDKKDNFFMINMDVPEMNDIHGCLKHLFNPRTIEYMCPGCSKVNKSQEIKTFTTLPPVLVLALCRLYYDWDKEIPIKVHDYLEFPLDIDLSSYSRKKVRNGTYKLTGIICHDGGPTGGSFHSYVMYNFGGKENWYKIERGTITECIMDENLLKEKCFGGETTCEAYILFYTRSEG